MSKKTFKTFLDSNVILSGLISEKGPPRIVLDVLTLRLPFLTGSTGKYNLIEIERNLKKKMPGLLSVYKKYLPRLNLKIIPLPVSAEIKEFSGKIADKDIPILVSAIRGKADFLVTGDKQHYSFSTNSPISLRSLSLPPFFSTPTINTRSIQQECPKPNL